MECKLIQLNCTSIFQFLPESARYLVAAGRKEDAMAVLKQAAKLNRKTLPKGNVVNVHIVSYVSCMFSWLYI